ncbi:MAG: TM2 domain-containing protein [Succinivibrionaceae bacterium]|jgi:hypothetical protein|nr:TM2 domain-containing protein [Succinivibrionaceae bacterium]MCI6198780.1 TM2 domain-containing protein [Pseudomonadota bacterium]MDY3144514.1 TM2 domain-containing protein [Succinivibrionaceae bacterium]
MHCSKCGYVQPDGIEGNFCPRCGALMKKDGFGTRTAEGSTQGQSQNQWAGGAGQHSAVSLDSVISWLSGRVKMAKVHPVDKVTYIVYAFFFGIFGVEEFYSGHNKLGLLCLCFCWTSLPLWWGIFRGIRAVFIPSDDNGLFTV